METEKHFNLLRNFLSKHEYLHEKEALDRYKSAIACEYQEWINELLELSLDDFINIENNYDISKLKNTRLKDYVQSCRDLVQIEFKNSDSIELDSNISRKMSLKKQHEIKWIVSHLKNENITNIIDIGSGAAHLSSALLDDDKNRKSLCIDANKNFQEMGIAKLKRWSPQILERITFKNAFVDESFSLESIDNSCLIGLHSCGKLSVDVIKLFQKSNIGQLVNFGCCYHKLSDEYNLSKASRVSAITLTNHALTMAAKCHSLQDIISYKEKIRVKKYRYGLHYFCVNELNLKVQSIGNTTKEDSALLFSDYLKKYLPANLQSDIDFKKADLYISSTQFETQFKESICLGLLRSLLGRVIELYILSDRILWLNEMGVSANLYQAFDRSLSPRNIGIFASKN